ncbi:MAG: bacterioferritin [Polyangiales bacterium]
MKSDPKILDALNEVLTAELTAVNMYFLASKLFRHWGFEGLAGYMRKESIDEMKHAEALIDRILYLDGLPNVQRLNKVKIGETVPEQFTLDLEEEHAAVARLNTFIELARSLGDHGTDELLRKILVSEEEHVDWLATQIYLSAPLGDTPYLADQIRR